MNALHPPLFSEDTTLSIQRAVVVGLLYYITKEFCDPYEITKPWHFHPEKICLLYIFMNGATKQKYGRNQHYIYLSKWYTDAEYCDASMRCVLVNYIHIHHTSTWVKREGTCITYRILYSNRLQTDIRQDFYILRCMYTITQITAFYHSRLNDWTNEDVWIGCLITRLYIACVVPCHLKTSQYNALE